MKNFIVTYYWREAAVRKNHQEAIMALNTRDAAIRFYEKHGNDNVAIVSVIPA